MQGVQKAFADLSSQDTSIETKASCTHDEATQLVEDGWIGLVVLCVSDKKDLIDAVDFMTEQNARIQKEKTLRVIIFNKLPGKRIESHFTNLGSSEILDHRANGKAVVHKMQRHLKLVLGANSADGTSDVSGAGNRNRGNAQDAAEPTIEPLPALAHPADFWLVRSPPDAKRASNRWNIELIGPSPAAGQWVPNGSNAYEWQPRDPQGPFSNTMGRWIFIGRMVQFFQHSRRWRFTGDKISLVFYEGDKIVAQRFIAESPILMKVAENSEPAKAKQPQIEQSFEDKDWGVGEGKVSESEDQDFRYQEEVRKSKELELKSGKEEANAWSEHKSKAGEEADWKQHASDNPDSPQWKEHASKDPSSPGQNGHDSEAAGEGSPLEKREGLVKTGEDRPAGAPEASRASKAENPIGKEPAPALTRNTLENSIQRLAPLEGEKNVLNSERGTSGKHRSSSGYIEEEFSTLDDAFKKVQVNATVNGKKADILESDDLTLVLRVDPFNLQPGADVLFKAVTENMRPRGSVSTRCKVLKQEKSPEGADLQMTIQLKEECRNDWQLIQAGVESRQMNILRFFKMAKGA
jgi:hypothetical protein